MTLRSLDRFMSQFRSTSPVQELTSEQAVQLGPLDPLPEAELNAWRRGEPVHRVVSATLREQAESARATRKRVVGGEHSHE